MRQVVVGVVLCSAVLAQAPSEAPGPRGAEAYAAACAQVQSWPRRFPELVELREIGKSVEGRPLWVARISKAPADRNVAEVYLGGGIHGHERSEQDALWLAEQVLLAAEAEPVDELLRQRVLWVQPMVNPDGVVQRERKNARRVDLNRNFGHLWFAHREPNNSRYPGPEAFSEPESRAVRDFLSDRPLRAYLDIHRSAHLIFVAEIGRGGAFAAPQLRAFQELNDAMGGHHRSDEPIALREDAGFTIDWVHGARGVMAFTWELDEPADGPAVEDVRWRGLLHILAHCADYPVSAKP